MYQVSPARQLPAPPREDGSAGLTGALASYFKAADLGRPVRTGSRCQKA
jgi:hypothetical protein